MIIKSRGLSTSNTHHDNTCDSLSARPEHFTSIAGADHVVIPAQLTFPSSKCANTNINEFHD